MPLLEALGLEAEKGPEILAQDPFHPLLTKIFRRREKTLRGPTPNPRNLVRRKDCDSKQQDAIRNCGTLILIAGTTRSYFADSSLEERMRIKPLDPVKVPLPVRAHPLLAERTIIRTKIIDIINVQYREVVLNSRVFINLPLPQPINCLVIYLARFVS